MSELKLKTDEHFMKYYKMLHKHANNYVRVGLGDKEDMFQEASMIYLKACDTYKPEKAKFSTHLVKLLENHKYDLLRKKKKEVPTVSLDRPVNQHDEAPFTFLDLQHNRSFIYIEGKISKMLYKGLSTVSIARRLGVSRPTVYAWLEKEKENMS